MVALPQQGAMPRTRTAVLPHQRFSNRTLDCPICGSNRDAVEGHCWGFLDDDGKTAVCTRPEHRGTLRETSVGYRHRLDGPCPCGVPHGGSLPIADGTSAGTADPKPRTRTRYPGIRDVWPDGWRRTMTFHYHRADGSWLYDVVRYDPPTKGAGRKKFYPWQQLEDGQWVHDEEGISRVLYRLPELLAVPLNRPVCVPEGEKCADALWKVGIPATCAPGGAENWHRTPDAREAFRDRTVVVLADNDEKGRKHARQVADDLRGVARTVRILNLPGLDEGGDVFDWLAVGGTALQLLELALCTPAESIDQDASADPETAAPASAEEADPETVNWKLTAMHQREQSAWRNKMWSNPRVRASIKQTAALVVESYTDMRRRDADGFMPVHLPTWAERLSIGSDTMSDHFAKLEKAKCLERRYVRTINANGMPVQHLSVKPTPLLIEHPEQAEVASQWGGKRVKTCASCGSSNLVERRQLVCKDCGTIHWTRDEPVNEPEPEANEQEAPAQDSCPRRHLDVRGQESGDSAPSQGTGAAQKNSLHADVYAGESHPTVEADGDTGPLVLWEAEQAFACVLCGADAEYYTPAGDPVCATHVDPEPSEAS